MPLPASWTTITVTATFTRADTAGPAAGSVQFTPVKAVGIAADVVLPALITATLNGSGQISVALPCPNSAGVTSLVYEVIERVPGGRSYYIEVLASMAGSIALADFDTLTDDQAAYYSLRGPTGDVTPSALAAQAAAETAADAAAASASAAAASIASGDIYATTTAGLAATTSEQYFSVPSADSAEYLILYKNNAGSAVEVKRYPSAASISSFKQCSAIYAGNLDTVPSQIASALALAGVSISQDFYSGVVGVSASEANPAAMSGTKKTFYINPATGNDANSGLTRALAKKSLGALVASASRTEDTEVIIIGGPHIFYRDQSLAGVTWNKPYHLSIVAEEEAIITSGELPSAMTWTALSTAWQATRSSSKAVYDAGFRDYRGIPRRLARAASVSEVQATPGTWYDDGTTVTVRTHDSRMPDANIIVQVTTGTVKFIPQAGKTVFLKNLKIAQHRTGYTNVSVEVGAGDTGYFKAINCAFIGGDRNAFESLRTSVCYLRDCTATQGGWDGFNHHDNSTAPQSVVIEFGCHGYKNGAVGGTDYNNSTAHDGLTIVRANCLHYESYGPSVADVNGCYSFNLNCISGRSYLESGSTAASWYFDNSVRLTPGAAWLIGCVASDSLYDINAQNSSVSVNVRGWRGAPVVGPNAAITRY